MRKVHSLSGRKREPVKDDIKNAPGSTLSLHHNVLNGLKFHTWSFTLFLSLFLYQPPSASLFSFWCPTLCLQTPTVSQRLPSILPFKIQENPCCLLSFLIIYFHSLGWLYVFFNLYVDFGWGTGFISLFCLYTLCGFVQVS